MQKTKIVALNSYIRNKKGSENNNLNSFKKLGKEYKIYPNKREERK